MSNITYKRDCAPTVRNVRPTLAHAHGTMLRENRGLYEIEDLPTVSELATILGYRDEEAEVL